MEQGLGKEGADEGRGGGGAFVKGRNVTEGDRLTQ